MRASIRVGPCMAGAMFCALVAAILGAVPGWTMCFACWVVLSWLMLGWIVPLSALLALRSLFCRRWAELWLHVRRALGIAAVMLGILPLGMLADLVSLAECRADLVARADASARAGGPRLAMTSDDGTMEATGFVYDPGHALAQPVGIAHPAWRDDPALKSLSGGCLSVSHFAGDYYRWRNACDGMF